MVIREYRVFENTDGIYLFRRRFDLKKEALWWIQEETRHHPDTIFKVVEV